MLLLPNLRIQRGGDSMRIGFISTYPPIECGIATYTQYLTDALRSKQTDIYVVSHIGGSGPQVFSAFDYEDGDLAEKAFSTMTRFTPDVVHIQHEFGLYGKHLGVSVVPLILEFKMLGIPVVSTLHTVYTDMDAAHRTIVEAVITNSDRVIVHEPYQLDTLKGMIPDPFHGRIKVIPHGAREIEIIPDAKRMLGLPEDRKVILIIGYIRPSKNFEVIIDIFPEILERYPNAILVMAGKTRGQEYVDYRNQLLDRIANSPARDNIVIIRGQLPQPVFDQVLCAADVVVLPYKIVSQSGILAHCLAFGRPLVASSSKALVDTLGRARAGLVCDSKDEFVNCIVRVLKDEALAQEFSDNGRRFVKENISWSIIADRHLELYRDITDAPKVDVRIITTE